MTGSQDKVTGKQAISKWIADRLADPKWVVKMKARSDEADAYLRSEGLLPDE